MASASNGQAGLSGRISHLDDSALDLIFRTARTHKAWQPRPVSDRDLRRLYELFKFGPTSVNCNPARFLFVRSPDAKAKLIPALIESNVPKVTAAPVTAIIGYDTRFFEHLPRLFPATDPKRFRSDPAFAERYAFRNATLQGAYLIIAARALGFDVGPMSGFDNAKVDAAFFAGTSIMSNFLCNIGYAEQSELPPRPPRFEFDEVCTIV
ncbi:MAG: malonic semialdehyde reductase [Betaproteobacteria bacterium RIFCSPLOWO2_12_FULL_62_13]|nr:MAG: malonic semialdehyde reductase [Betaproteobacteria bacterium RIFCSPLOWO2_12_FULL_62_13]